MRRLTGMKYVALIRSSFSFAFSVSLTHTNFPFYDQLFLRGMPELHAYMRPQLHHDRAFHAPDCEPDFYKLRPLPDLPHHASRQAEMLQALLAQESAKKARYQVLTEALALVSRQQQQLQQQQYHQPSSSSQEVASLASTTAGMVAAQELHEESLVRLSKAQEIANRSSSEEESSLQKKKATSPDTNGSKRKGRRKWLPPLGPPSASQQQATTSGGDCEWFFTNAEVFASLSELGKK